MERWQHDVGSGLAGPGAEGPVAARGDDRQFPSVGVEALWTSPPLSISEPAVLRPVSAARRSDGRVRPFSKVLSPSGRRHASGFWNRVFPRTLWVPSSLLVRPMALWPVRALQTAPQHRGPPEPVCR